MLKAEKYACQAHAFLVPSQFGIFLKSNPFKEPGCQRYL